MKRSLRSLLLLLSLSFGLSVSGESGPFESMPIDQVEIAQWEVVTPSKISELLKRDFEIFYLGSWNEWHLFRYCGYTDSTAMDPMWKGVFKCAAAGLKLDQQTKIDLAIDKKVSPLSQRRVLGFDPKNAELTLGPTVIDQAIKELGYEGLQYAPSPSPESAEQSATGTLTSAPVREPKSVESKR